VQLEVKIQTPNLPQRLVGMQVRQAMQGKAVKVAPLEQAEAVALREPVELPVQVAVPEHLVPAVAQVQGELVAVQALAEQLEQAVQAVQVERLEPVVLPEQAAPQARAALQEQAVHPEQVELPGQVALQEQVGQAVVALPVTLIPMNQTMWKDKLTIPETLRIVIRLTFPRRW
jgi:hypothetical protein